MKSLERSIYGLNFVTFGLPYASANQTTKRARPAAARMARTQEIDVTRRIITVLLAT